MKVLLAEDDRDFGNILSQYISISGYDVTLGRDGKEAWELFNKDKFDICVFDVMMPEMDGFTLAEKVKEAQQDMPLIFLTAKSLKEDIVRGLKIGADDYITKPFDPEVLILRINNILKRAYSSANDEFKNFKYHSQIQFTRADKRKHKGKTYAQGSPAPQIFHYQQEQGAGT
jgi:DNA-binding response OmpR family regulator